MSPSVAFSCPSNAAPLGIARPLDDPDRVKRAAQTILDDLAGNPDHDAAMASAHMRFTRLAAAEIKEAATRVLLGQIMAVSALPSHYVGVFTDNPASADALRASEASLMARAKARQAWFGRSWEDVARLVVGVREGTDPASVDVRVRWAEAATRSVAQEADAIVKL